MVVPTDYPLGSEISWEVSFNNYSSTDYTVLLNITHNGVEVISTHKNISSFDMDWPLEIGSPWMMNCDFEVEDEWGMDECLDAWMGDYNPSYEVGEHCFKVTLVLKDGGAFSETDEVCNWVYATGEISIDLTEEYWEEVGICWDNENLDQEDCEAMGYNWDPYYSEMIIPSEYEYGSLISWEVSFSNYSSTDYTVHLEITHDNQAVLDSNFKNLSAYEMENPLRISAPWMESCDFTVGDYDCLDDWMGDYNPSYVAGEHCFKVTLTLQDGGDFSVSDEICHTLLPEVIPEKVSTLLWEGTVNEEITSFVIPASSEGVVIEISHLDIHSDGYGEITFYYQDGTSESVVVWGNNAMNVVDSSNTSTQYGGGTLGDYSDGIIESAGLIKEYSFEQTSFVGKNTWIINANSGGLQEIAFEEFSGWRGFTDMTISYLSTESDTEVIVITTNATVNDPTYGGEDGNNTAREGDSDNDGVPDIWDECPDTPENKPTDRDGCEFDLDDLVDSSSGDDGGMPGFSAVFGIVALLGAAITMRRKQG